MTTSAVLAAKLPGDELDAGRMPGHWLLARLGKRVLRPGGVAMTEALIADLDIDGADDVVELAPGLGLTARLILDKGPRSYTGVERDPAAATWTAGRLADARVATIRVGSAEHTGLPEACASVVLGEAMLSMAPTEHKSRIMNEAFRILRPGGAYAIHELAIVPDDVPATVKKDIEETLSAAIHVGARPLTHAEWCHLLAQAGFTVDTIGTAPMGLLRPGRIVADEGLWRALRFFKNVLTNADARRRVLKMRRTFHKYRAHLGAISIVARKSAMPQ